MNLFTRKAASVAAFTVVGLTAGGIAWGEVTSTPSAPVAASSGATSAVTGSDLSASAGAAGPAARLRGLGRRVLHGEVVLQTKKGFVTAVIARGTVSSVDGNSISVKSADGVTTTFGIDAKTKARSAGQAIAVGAVHVGDRVGVLGVKSGSDNPVARIIRKLPASANNT